MRKTLGVLAVVIVVVVAAMAIKERVEGCGQRTEDAAVEQASGVTEADSLSSGAVSGVVNPSVDSLRREEIAAELAIIDMMGTDTLRGAVDQDAPVDNFAQ